MNPHLSLDPSADLSQLLAYPFMVNALEAGTVVALMAAVTGWFMVLRRQSFAGHTLAITSFPGASGAALAGIPLAAGYFVSCAVAATARPRTSRKAGSSRRTETPRALAATGSTDA